MRSKFRGYAKVVARQVLPPIVFSVLRPNRQLPRPFSLFHGKDQIDKKMLKYIDYDDGYFIEIGAGDGVHLSNTYYYEKYRNWSGVLIDPILHHHLSCLQHRSNSKSYLCAASSFENTNDIDIDVECRLFYDWNQFEFKHSESSFARPGRNQLLPN
jgi:hypothetical protein